MTDMYEIPIIRVKLKPDVTEPKINRIRKFINMSVFMCRLNCPTMILQAMNMPVLIRGTLYVFIIIFLVIHAKGISGHCSLMPRITICSACFYYCFASLKTVSLESW